MSEIERASAESAAPSGLSPEMIARIDATIAQYRAWQEAGRCYACGDQATHRVTLRWMGEGGRLYCSFHAWEWSHAGWPRHVAPIDGIGGAQ